MLRLITSMVLGTALFVFVGWQMGLLWNASDPSLPDVNGGELPPKQKLNLGKDLFAPAAFPKTNDGPVAQAIDPVVIPAHLAPMDKIDVASDMPGKLLFVGEDFEGAAQIAGVTPFLNDPYESAKVLQVGGQELTKIYRRFYEGNIVHDDQMVAMIDPTKAYSELAGRQAEKKQAEAEYHGAKAGLYESELRLQRLKQLREGGGVRAVSEEEVSGAIYARAKFHAEMLGKKAGVNVALVKEEAAQVALRRHEIRNLIPVKTSFIKTIYRNRGEALKEGEPVMQLYSLDRLMAEALVDTAYQNRVRQGAVATIEPVDEQAPLRTLTGHRGAVHALAVTRDPARPLIVSASEDGTVLVWDRLRRGASVHEFPHMRGVALLPVRAVTCTGPTAKRNLILSGCSDGSLWLTDLEVPTPAPKEIKDKHGDAITAVAFSHDGAYFASASADGEIKLFRTEDGQLMYPFDAEHGVTSKHLGQVTSLHFTPQCRLVSAGRDNTIRVWNLKELGATLAFPIPDRTGAILNLGVSQKGGLMLFDQGKTLQVRRVEDGRLVTTLQNPHASAPFETLALFSPDDSLLLTAGAGEGRLQLWQAPTESARGFEIRQLTAERSQVSCAAFAPLAATGQCPFIASGTKEGTVHVWAVPTPGEKHRIHNVRINLVSTSLDAGTRQVRIGVEVPNPDGRLIPGRPVTIVIE